MKKWYWTGALVCIVVCSFNAASFSGETIKMQLVDCRKIWDKAPHNAFTDLIRFKGKWFCTFREGKAHVSKDGRLRVIMSSDGQKWESAALITSETEDLRDAKLDYGPEGTLVLCGAGVDKRNKPQVLTSYIWTSPDGITWSKPIAVCQKDEWLWRITGNKGVYYGIAYDCKSIWKGKKKNYIRLYSSKDCVKFTPVGKALRSGKDYSNESEIVFHNDTAYCLLRRDMNTNATALWGVSRPPYTAWEWNDLNVKIGGPAMIRLNNGKFLAVLRLYNKTRTSVCVIDPDKLTLTESVKLPSGGDTSYAGIVLEKDTLWISYYSSHEKKTCIYLARVKISQ